MPTAPAAAPTRALMDAPTVVARVAKAAETVAMAAVVVVVATANAMVNASLAMASVSASRPMAALHPVKWATHKRAT